jgi:hypothetical protein
MTNKTQLVSGGGGYFQATSIDNVPALLEKSYALRYQVYCLERKFLRAENYPSGLEIDEFDRHAIHVGAASRRGARTPCNLGISEGADAVRAWGTLRRGVFGHALQHPTRRSGLLA